MKNQVVMKNDPIDGTIWLPLKSYKISPTTFVKYWRKFDSEDALPVLCVNTFVN